MSENKTTHDSFRERMAKFWAQVHRDLKRESDAGRGPWILTPAGRKWLTERRDGDARKPKYCIFKYAGKPECQVSCGEYHCDHA